MKQSSSTHLNAIPVNTNTLAGQWMTFSHMANHYRKLLNVKPRVNSGMVQGHSSSSYHNFTMQSSKSEQKRMGCGNTKSKKSTKSSMSNCNNINSNSVCKQPRPNSMYSSHPDHLNISGKTTKEGKSPSKSKKQTQPSYLHDEYQVVFGPSSIRSSIDAFMSDDTESIMSNEKLPSEEAAPLGVTEKIRRFLHHIHQLDLTTTKSKRVTTAPATSVVSVTCPSSKCSQQPQSSATTLPNKSSIDFRLSRHAKCFLPCETSPKTSTTKCKKDPTLHSRTGKPAGPSNQLSNCVQHHDFYSPKSSRKSLTGKDFLMLPEKDLNGNNRDKSRKRASSVASIGTVCGSEELMPEDFLISSKPSYSSRIDLGLSEDAILGIGDNHKPIKARVDSSPRVKHFEKDSHNKKVQYSRKHASSSAKLLKSNSMTSLLHNNGKSSHTVNGPGTNHTKDSSRDSAYGFSSGDSRITTRESTPEKKCHQFVSSCGASHGHVGFEDQPCKDVSIDGYTKKSTSSKFRPTGKHSHSRFSEEQQHQHTPSRVKKERGRGQKGKSTVDLNQPDSSEKYITFLADVTQDIVSKGIYTNKGLKNLFKSYMDQNKELNQEKLSDMLERLRMDLGIPKDDALDKLEFGYGSITNPSNTTFFYTPSDFKKSTSNTNMPSEESHLFNDNLNQPLPSTSSSPPTFIPTVPTTTTGFSSGPNTSSNRSTTTTEEGLDIISVPGSDRDEMEKNHFDDIDDDELSLSDSEVTQALRIAGLDDGTTEEVMGILKC